MTLSWWRDSTTEARRALIAASLGWMLDAFDVMLFALMLPAIMHELAFGKATAGALASLTLIASAAGGLVFGIIADRYGRTRALSLSILLYSVFTAACGLATSVAWLAVCRILLGLGFGGEWASGAALVSETWPEHHRGKALGIVQSSWAVGYALAALVTLVVQPRFGWRAVFFVGLLPALLTLWIRRSVREPEAWLNRRHAAASLPWRTLMRPPFAHVTIVLTLMNACTLFAWWGFNLWVPSYLSLPTSAGGLGVSAETMSILIVVMQIGTWFGYVTFGFVSDEIGRRRTYVVYLLAAAALVQVYAWTPQPALLLLLGPVLAFFASGHFSGFGAITADLFPTEIRARAQGFTYNIGRLASAAAPIAVGALAEQRGFDTALTIVAAAFVLAAVMWTWIPSGQGTSTQPTVESGSSRNQDTGGAGL